MGLGNTSHVALSKVGTALRNNDRSPLVPVSCDLIPSEPSTMVLNLIPFQPDIVDQLAHLPVGIRKK